MTYYIEMLGLPFLACILMTFILGYIGTHVLKREIIFIDIALAQVAAFGAITAHIFFHAHEDSILSYLFSFGFTLVVALFFSLARKKITQIPLEAIIGISYAIAASATLFLIGVIPGAHSHVTEMLSGSILWIEKKDIGYSIGIFLFVSFFFYYFRAIFDKISSQYENLKDSKINIIWWDFLFYALVGIVITQSVKIGGVLLVFGFLIIPATLSLLFVKNSFSRLLITWTTGIVASFFGLLFANAFDFSVGPSVCLILGGILVVAGLITKILPTIAKT